MSVKLDETRISKGFTLIELLLVIAIIGILAGIIVRVIDVQEYQKQARDARRMNDVLSVQTAIIDSIANNNISLSSTLNCADCSSDTGTTSVDGDGWVKFNNLKNRGMIDIISSLPKDPTNDGTYHFSYYSDGNDFEINANFESKRYLINAQNDGGNDPNVYERGFNLKLH